MWDTGCSLPGLITLTKFEEWKERFGMKLKHEKWYEKGKEISGVSADNPVMMMGTVVFEFSHGGRSFDLEFGVLKGGDTGSADVIVGNYVLRSDRYDGAVDVGAGVVTLRKVDSRGVMKIPVTTELAGLASMLAAHMAHGESECEGAAHKDEAVPAAFDASKGRMILDEEFLTLLPGEARWCHVKLQDQAGAVMDGQSFVAMDGEHEDAASGMELAEKKALLESGDGGAAHVMVRNNGENPMEFDRDDGICGVQLVDRTEIRAAGEVTKEMRSGLDPECSALFAQYELESKAEASGRREHETFTAVSLKEGEVFEVALQDPARGKSTRPRPGTRQSTRPRPGTSAKYQDQKKAQKLAFGQHQKAHEERPTGRRQVAAHASSEREPAGRKREKDDQPTAGRRGDETTQSRPWPSSRALPSAEMQSMPHDVTPSIALHGISSAAPGGSWPRACGDHLER